jgi:hypothetical protein
MRSGQVRQKRVVDETPSRLRKIARGGFARKKIRILKIRLTLVTLLEFNSIASHKPIKRLLIY